MTIANFFKKKNINEISFRKEFFEIAFNYLKYNNSIKGSYLEFGVFRGNTFNLALNILGNKNNEVCKHFYALDSFKGMPKSQGIDRHKIWEKNKNFFSEENFQKKFKNNKEIITIIPGYYEESLKKFKLKEEHEKIALAYIDCDFYSSTTEVLNWLKNNLCHGMILAFDDWDLYFGDPQRGQKKAFIEFKNNQNDWHFEEFFRIKSGGHSFIALDNSKIGKEVYEF